MSQAIALSNAFITIQDVLLKGIQGLFKSLLFTLLSNRRFYGGDVVISVWNSIDFVLRVVYLGNSLIGLEFLRFTIGVGATG